MSDTQMCDYRIEFKNEKFIVFTLSNRIQESGAEPETLRRGVRIQLGILYEKADSAGGKRRRSVKIAEF